MTFYIIDILSPKTKDLTDQEQILAEQLYLHRDLFRGCSVNWNHMMNYYQYLEHQFGKYFTLGTYKYERQTSFDDVPVNEIDEDTLSAIGLSIYNADKTDHTNTVGTMPVIQALPLEWGGMFYMTNAMQELMNERYFTEMEFSILVKFVAVFVELYQYLPCIYACEDIDWLRVFILSGIPRLICDFYDTSNRIHVDPVYLNKVLIETFVFLG